MSGPDETGELKEEGELQDYTVHRIEGYLKEKGKRIIGWDEYWKVMFLKQRLLCRGEVRRVVLKGRREETRW